ncbi:MAG: hypothetical protein CMK08_00845 [Ponticaulis sp.]|nr:hypothetical protein [Ponticaulis sp.]
MAKKAQNLMALKPLLSILTLCLALALPSGADSGRRIALTYDDAPRADTSMNGDERVEMLIDGLATAGVEQAAIFVVTSRINSPQRLARIQSFAEAGHVIANHSHTHPWLRNVTAEEYLAEIDTAEMILQVFENRRPWFRFPYLNEAPDIERRDAVREGLAERDLFSGYVTVDTYDWHLDSLYQRAVNNGETVCMSGLRDLYTGMLVEAANFFDQAAREYLDEVPAQVMLLHENDVAALFVTDLVAALEADGWEIITADEAYEDPIASVLPDTRFLGMGRVAALTSLAGKPGPEFTYLAVEENQINAAFEEHVLGACNTTLLTPAPVSVSEDNERLCDMSNSGIEPEYQIDELMLKPENAEAAFNALREYIPDLVEQAQASGGDASLNHGETGMTYHNNLNFLEGLTLRQNALLEQAEGTSGPATDAFCEFLNTTSVRD